MTVREAFSKAFGDVPEGATCHVKCQEDEVFTPTFWIATQGYSQTIKETLQWFGQWDIVDRSDPCEPDISGRPAESFRGFFGKEYDDVLDAHKEKI